MTKPIPEANRPGHHPDHEQDKPIEAFVARAQAKVRETETAPIRDRARVIEAQIDNFFEEKRGADPGAGARGGIPIEAVFPALAFVDAALKPGSAWNQVGASKRAWMAGIALLPGFGAWRYAAHLKPRLDAAAKAVTLMGA